MDTSKYDAATRKDLKRFQRSAGYQAMKATLREREATIVLLKKKLVEAGFDAAAIAKLAA